jgi:hypothetical protein
MRRQQRVARDQGKDFIHFVRRPLVCDFAKPGRLGREFEHVGTHQLLVSASCDLIQQ